MREEWRKEESMELMKHKRKEWRRKGERIGERKEVTNVCEQGVENEKIDKNPENKFFSPIQNISVFSKISEHNVESKASIELPWGQKLTIALIVIEEAHWARNLLYEALNHSRTHIKSPTISV